MRKVLTLFMCMLLVLAVPAQAMTLSLKDYDNGHVNFDAVNKVIGITLNTSSDGVLYVYSGDRSDFSTSTENLVYAEYIAGSPEPIVKDISLANIDGKYGEYKVEFYSGYPDIVVVSDGFSYLSAGEGLLLALLSIANPNGGIVEEIITSNSDYFDALSEAADMSDYDNVDNKSAVYAGMASGLSSLESFEDIVELFEEAAHEQYSEENSSSKANTPGGGKKPSSTVMVTGGNGSSGGTSVTPPTPVIPEDTKPEPQPSFTDMSGHWGEDYAKRLQSLGIINGYEDGTFRGDNFITRAELAKTLVEAFDIPLNTNVSAYNDITSTDWSYDYILAANASGLVKGFDDGSFKPNLNVLRQDAVLMLYRAMALKISMTASSLGFADSQDIAEYAAEAVSALAGLKIITGDDTNSFNPTSELSRAELAALICRSLDSISSK